MNVLSLFNGMSFGMMALETLNVPVTNYYSSEIDKYANQAAQALFPDVIQLGDVTKWDDWDIDLGSIDLLLAGFPCQAWSMAGKQKGDDDPRGALVHDLIAIWQMINEARECYGKEPVKFMFENVKMKKEFLDYINDLFGVEPIMINSSLVSAQDRKRYYWTNIGEIEQPEDKGILFRDIFNARNERFVRNSDAWHTWWSKNKEFQIKKKYSQVCNDKNKAITLTARMYASWNGNFIQEVYQGTWCGNYRKLTPTECLRLQTVPEHHISALLGAISSTQLYKMCGNGWTHDVIVHIFKGLLND